jgi:hypothetical protein
MVKYKVELSERGKDVFKGGNIPVMRKYLKTYDSMRDVEKAFLIIGAGSRDLFKVREVI